MSFAEKVGGQTASLRLSFKIHYTMLNDYLLGLDDLKNLHQYLHEVPFDVIRKKLYTCYDLFDAFDPYDPMSFQRCYDTRVFMHVTKMGKQSTSRRENVARGIHDTCILNSMQAFLHEYDQVQVVGVMGGHAMLRTDDAYRQTVLISKRLTELGFLMISGGGPGAMEATHLGAWMAGRTEEEVDEALSILAPSPKFESNGWLATGFDVISRFPQTEYKSLAIPTWYYGHEPPTVFASHIAKFFNNSIREDTILTEAYGGLIYMQGSAGTLQEIFQEAVQDHYVSLGYASPMVFVGKEFWTKTVPVWPFIQDMMRSGHYKNLILDLCDTLDEVVDSIVSFRFSKPRTR